VEAQSKMQQAQAVYDIAKEKWEDCRLTAPGDGIIGRKSANAGETVAPRQPVVTLLDVHQIKVRVSVPEKEINDIRSESVCYIDVPAAGLTGLQGERIVKNVKSDLLTHTYDIQIHLSNPDNRILPGMIGEVRFPQEVSKNISLPVTAVQQVAGGKHFVWTVSDGKACQKAVQVGKTHGARIVITEGLQAGEVVVTAGYQKLSTGTNVNVR